MLKPGGMMLYSTCTFDSEENEGTIEYLLEQYPEFQICEIAPYEGFCPGLPEVSRSKREDLSRTVRMFPHKLHGEGHYVALLQKGEQPKEENEEQTRQRRIKADRIAKTGVRKIPEELEAFFENVSWDLEKSRLEIHGECVYYMPEDLPDVRGIRFLRTGLLLGELKKNRFEPSQAFAMNLKKEEYRYCLCLSAEDERVVKYLKGETLDVEDLVSPKEKGWYLICVDEYPLGWGKLSAGTVKNKYLPGWRWQS